MNRWQRDMLACTLKSCGSPAFFRRGRVAVRKHLTVAHRKLVGCTFELENARGGLLTITLDTCWGPAFPVVDISWDGTFYATASTDADLEAALDWFISALRPLDPGMAQQLTLGRTDWRTTSY